MGTIFAVHAVIDTLTQDGAPSYDTLQAIFQNALSQALARFSPSKVQGIRWLGPGPRVVRKVHEAALNPGGVTHATWVLGYTGAPPDILTQREPGRTSSEGSSEIAGLGTDINQSIFEQLVAQGFSRESVGVSAPWFDTSTNGPESFWTGPSASVTRTRDRFPQTNVLGTPSVDQNENPIGPTALNPGPSEAPSVIPTGTGAALTTLTILGLGIVGLYFAWPFLAAARSAKKTFANPRPNPRVVTKDTRREARRIHGGAKDLTQAKRAAHRAERRYVKSKLRSGHDDFGGRRPRVTGWDIS